VAIIFFHTIVYKAECNRMVTLGVYITFKCSMWCIRKIQYILIRLIDDLNIIGIVLQNNIYN